MDPAVARSLCRKICWSKIPRTLDEATQALGDMIRNSGQDRGGIYRCRLSDPAGDPHWHLTSKISGMNGPDGAREIGARPRKVREAIDALGDEAYRRPRQ